MDNNIIVAIVICIACVCSIGIAAAIYTNANQKTPTQPLPKPIMATTYSQLSNNSVPGSSTTTTTTSVPTVSGIEKNLPRTLWPQIVAPTPDAKIDTSEKPYFGSYDIFLKACVNYPLFGTDPDPIIAKREIAAFFANVKQETHFVVNREQNCLNNPCDWIEKPQKSPVCSGDWKTCGFYGRGPIQLTHHYNYKAASQSLYKDDRLFKNPDLVARDPDVGWATALYFWFENKLHEAMTKSRTAPFNITIRTINGSLECDKSTPGGLNRVAYFKEYCKLLGVEPGPESDLKCW